MQITQEELRRRLDSKKNLVSAILPVEQAVPNTPSSLPDNSKTPKPAIATRIVAGSLALQGESIRDIACEFGLKDSQVRSAAKSRAPEIKGPIQTSLERVSELAIDKMLMVFGLMTVDKFENTNVKDLSIVAANMGRIIEKVRAPESDNRVQLIIYAPEQRSERSYRVVDV